MARGQRTPKIRKLVRKKYGGDETWRFGPTLAAEHLPREDRFEVHPDLLSH
jgi:hypothetical protein